MDPMFDDSNKLLDEKHKKKAERVKYTKSGDVLHQNKVEYKDMNELVRLVNIELHQYWKLTAELEKLTHEDLDEMFNKILEAPKKQDMDLLMRQSYSMRDEI